MKQTKRKVKTVPVNGIEPFFEAYESPVLPLNYTGDKSLKLKAKIVK